MERSSSARDVPVQVQFQVQIKTSPTPWRRLFIASAEGRGARGDSSPARSCDDKGCSCPTRSYPSRSSSVPRGVFAWRCDCSPFAACSQSAFVFVQNNGGFRLHEGLLGGSLATETAVFFVGDSHYFFCFLFSLLYSVPRFQGRQRPIFEGLHPV